VLTTPQYFDKYFISFPSAKLLITASRCHFQQHLSHHFEIEKFINFLGRCTAPPQTPPLRCLRRLDSRVFGARPATPQCSSGVDAHAYRKLPSTCRVGRKSSKPQLNRTKRVVSVNYVVIKIIESRAYTTHDLHVPSRERRHCL